eukprot:2651219-Pleurochrysis_carterae.AAC.1
MASALSASANAAPRRSLPGAGAMAAILVPVRDCSWPAHDTRFGCCRASPAPRAGGSASAFPGPLFGAGPG